jgi:exosome complex component RRP45
MQRVAAGEKQYLISNESSFVEEALAVGLRIDKRQLLEMRPFAFEFPFATRGRCVVRLGDTCVNAAVTCELVDPAPYMPKQGFLDFSVRGCDGTRGGDSAEVARALEQQLKTGGAVDMESLCVLAGRKVWSVNVAVTVLNDEGNVIDAAMWAAIAALRHFRRPELTIQHDTVTVHAPKERDPVPLIIHHTPLSVTAAVMPQQQLVVDPLLPELAAAGSSAVTVALNEELQVCAVHKQRGLPVPYGVVKAVLAAAKGLVPQIAAAMNEAMAEDEKKRKAATLAQFEWAQKRTGVKQDAAAKRARDEQAVS